MLLLLLAWPIYRFKPRMSPGEWIFFSNRLGKIDPASEAFFRSHPETVQLFHRIMFHRLRAPADYQGQPVLGTLLHDLSEISEIPPSGTRPEEELIREALRQIRDSHNDLYAAVIGATYRYLGIQPPFDDNGDEAA